MKSEILYPGAFPMVRVFLDVGESIKAESGAMVGASPTIDVESKLEGGLLGALSRKLLTGEKFFFQTLRAARGRAKCCWPPRFPEKSWWLISTASTNTWFRRTDFWREPRASRSKAKCRV